jgi:hypothetical protein
VAWHDDGSHFNPLRIVCGLICRIDYFSPSNQTTIIESTEHRAQPHIHRRRLNRTVCQWINPDPARLLQARADVAVGEDHARAAAASFFASTLLTVLIDRPTRRAISTLLTPRFTMSRIRISSCSVSL